MADVNKTILLEYDVKTGKLVDENGKVIKSIDDVTGAYKKSKKAQDDYNNSTQQTAKSTKELNKLQEDQARSAGLAGAAAFELGRTISDLPFGLVAISNNISQLGTLFAALVANAGSLRKALKLLKEQLFGPAGLLIAFQAVTAAVTFFAQRSEKANKEADKFNSTLAELNTEVIKLELLGDIVRDGSASIEEQNAALQALKKSGFDPATQSIDDFIAAQQRLAISRATVELFAADIARLEKERLDLLQQSRDVLSDLVQAQQEVGQGPVDVLKAQVATIRERLKEIDSEVESSKERLKSLFRDEDLVDFLFGGTEAEGEPANKVSRKVKKLIAVYFGTTFQELEKREKEAEEIRRALGLPSIQDTLGASAAQATEEFVDFYDGFFKKSSETASKTRAMTAAEAIAFTQDTFNSITDLMDAQFQKELDIETAKTVALNDQLRERLRNEQLTADARDKINQEIARNEAELVAKENAINKKRFEQQKASNIANAVINTYLAANQALANPLDLNPFSKIASAVLVITAGLANVAAIASQQFVPKASPNPRLTGLGDGSGQTGPAFNIVGQSTRNQVAEAVGLALADQPLRAYVVSSDVTTAQELERKIVEGASI